MDDSQFRKKMRSILTAKLPSMTSLIEAGLTIGITCIILISLYVRYEFSYDRFHKNAKNI